MMPLPIPDIMQNAANALTQAKFLVDNHPEVGLTELREALKKIHPDDLLAVLNEIGKVYQSIHNPQISSFGTRANTGNNMLEIAINIDFGLGVRTLVTGIPPDNAEGLLKGMSNALSILKGIQPGAGQRIIANLAEG